MHMDKFLQFIFLQNSHWTCFAPLMFWYKLTAGSGLNPHISWDSYVIMRMMYVLYVCMYVLYIEDHNKKSNFEV